MATKEETKNASQQEPEKVQTVVTAAENPLNATGPEQPKVGKGNSDGSNPNVPEAPKNVKPVIVANDEEKMVNCKVIKSHRCRIGSYELNLKKDTDVKIPDSAAHQLSLSGIVIKK